MELTPLRQRCQEWLARNPQWSGWVNGQDETWTRLLQLREQGHTVAEAVAAMGLQTSAGDTDALTAQLRRQHDSVERQAATITELQDRLANVELDDLSPQARERLLAQARAQLGRRSWRNKIFEGKSPVHRQTPRMMARER